MNKQFRAATPEQINKFIKEILIADAELMAIGVPMNVIKQIVDEAVYKTVNQLSYEMQEKLDNFKTTGDPKLDHEKLVKQVVAPLLYKAREKILHKLITKYPLAVEKRLKADGFGIENPNNKNFLNKKGGNNYGKNK